MTGTWLPSAGPWQIELEDYRRLLSQRFEQTSQKRSVEGFPQIDGAFLAPYFKTVGLDAAPESVLAMLKEAGWAVYPTRADAKGMIDLVRASGLFDSETYRALLPNSRRDLDPLCTTCFSASGSGLLLPLNSTQPITPSETPMSLTRDGVCSPITTSMAARRAPRAANGRGIST